MKSTTRPSRRNGKPATTAGTPRSSGPSSAPASGALDPADQVDAAGPQQRRERLEQLRGVVVPGDGDHRPAARPAAGAPRARAQRLDRGSRPVEDVARDEHEIDPLLVGDPLRPPRAPRASRPCGRDGRGAADVPVGRVEDPHAAGRYRPANGSPSASVATSSLRVAHGGNGNVTTSGTGIAGWRHDHRAGLQQPRASPRGREHPAVLGALGLGGIQPAADPDRAFSRTSGATRRRVCCAPTSRTPSDRPRCAMSISMSFSGLVPSRGAYLFSSSSTTTDSGSRWPDSLLLAGTSRSAARRRRTAAPARAATGSRRPSRSPRRRSIRRRLAGAHELSQPRRAPRAAVA